MRRKLGFGVTASRPTVGRASRVRDKVSTELVLRLRLVVAAEYRALVLRMSFIFFVLNADSGR